MYPGSIIAIRYLIVNIYAQLYNTLICLIHQANYLLDQQLRQLEKQFLKEGGFTERLYYARQEAKSSEVQKFKK
jgi:four helix bundle suffix protein